MATVLKFDTANAAGGRQFVAHKVYVDGIKHSVWFSDAGLVDAERFDRLDRATGIKQGSPRWKALAARVPSLIAQYEMGN